MTSREIVIKLIDEHLITGEEAFTLINDIVASEIKAAMDVLKESKSNDSEIKWNGSKLVWTSPWTDTTTSPIGTYVYNTSTGTAASTLSASK